MNRHLDGSYYYYTIFYYLVSIVSYVLLDYTVTCQIAQLYLAIYFTTGLVRVRVTECLEDYDGNQ